MLRILPEFRSLELVEHADGKIEFGLRLQEDGVLRADELSQGVLYLVGILALSYDPTPPRVLSIEEPDRGIHPRMLREIRDLLYRLSYPVAAGLTPMATWVVPTWLVAGLYVDRAPLEGCRPLTPTAPRRRREVTLPSGRKPTRLWK